MIHLLDRIAGFYTGLFTIKQRQLHSSLLVAINTVPECRAGSLKLKSEIGCCYQSIYNNTHFLNLIFDAGLIPSGLFFGLQSIGNSAANPWMACNHKCVMEIHSQMFYPHQPAPWTTGQGSYPSFQMGLSVGLILQLFSVHHSQPTKLSSHKHWTPFALQLSCGGVRNQYLTTTCNDPSSSQLLELYCTPTLGGAVARPRCQFASGDISNTSTIVDNIILRCNTSTANPNTCTAECRESLVNLKSEFGCCYQSMYNN